MTQAMALVGRQEPLTLLHQMWSSAVGGAGSNLLIVGQAGIGKTRMVHHFLHSLAAPEVEVLCGTAYLPHDNLLYAPILEAFGAVLQRRSKKERAALVQGLDDLGRLFPDLGCVVPDSLNDAALEKTRLFHCFARLLERLAKSRPVLLFLDDLHWADAVTVELFHYLATAANQYPLLLVATMRQEALEENATFRKVVHSLARLPHTHQLMLGPLVQESTGQLFRQQIGGSCSPALLARLQQQTGGSPLFLCALLDALCAEGMLFFDGQHWNLTEQSWPLPPTIRDLVLERMERFSAESLELLQWLAICADGVTHALLCEVVQLPEDSLVEHIRQLCVPGFLCEVIRQGETFYHWTHPLVRQVIYSEIASATRHRLHAQWAALFEQKAPNDLYHLANHYCGMGAGSIHLQALEVLRKAGEEAKNLGAYHEASRFFSAALEAARVWQDKELLPDLLASLGEVWSLQGKTEQALQLLREALSIFRTLEQWRGVARIHLLLAHICWSQLAFREAQAHLEQGLSALDTTGVCLEWEQLQATRLVFLDRCYNFEQLSQLLHEIEGSSERQSFHFRVAVGVSELGFLMRQGEYQEALEKITSLLAFVEQTEDFVQIVRVRNFAGLLAFSMGEHALMEEHYVTNMALVKEHGLVGNEPSVLGVGGLADLLAGNWPRGLERAMRGVYMARMVNSDRYHARLHALCALLLAPQGKFAQAQEYLQSANEILGGRTDDIHMAASVWLTEAVYLYESGQPQAALEALQRLPAEGDALPLDNTLTTIFLLTWGHVLLALDRAEDVTPIMEALRHRGQGCEYCATWATYFTALQHQARGQTKQAEALLPTVAQIFARLSIPFAEARAWLAWFRCKDPQRSASRDSTFLQRVERALELFKQLDARHYIERTWNVLAPHGVTQATLRGYHRYLSRREMEIAALIVKGFKNTEIAACLHISPHTVSSHLKRIYTRLSINSRAELVHFVLTHQLLEEGSEGSERVPSSEFRVPSQVSLDTPKLS